VVRKSGFLTASPVKAGPARGYSCGYNGAVLHHDPGRKSQLDRIEMNGRAHLLGGFGATALLLAACAQAPETVAPAPVNEAQYHGWNCPELRGELGRLDRTLADLYAEQRQSRNDDAIGYVFALAPLATMSRGDLRHQIALRKGEHEAARHAAARRCHAARF
jgi:hypothetical protein